MHHDSGCTVVHVYKLDNDHFLFQLLSDNDVMKGRLPRKVRLAHINYMIGGDSDARKFYVARWRQLSFVASFKFLAGWCGCPPGARFARPFYFSLVLIMFVIKF